MAMDGVFRGSEALRQGKLSTYQLRSGFRAIYPDIYLPRYATPSLRTRSEAALLWSRRRGVLAGLAAAALHGSDWIDDDICPKPGTVLPYPPAFLFKSPLFPCKLKF